MSLRCLSLLCALWELSVKQEWEAEDSLSLGMVSVLTSIVKALGRPVFTTFVGPQFTQSLLLCLTKELLCLTLGLCPSALSVLLHPTFLFHQPGSLKPTRQPLRQSARPAISPLLHLVDLALIHHDADAQQESEHQLVLLEEAAADVAVEAVG